MRLRGVAGVYALKIVLMATRSTLVVALNLHDMGLRLDNAWIELGNLQREVLLLLRSRLGILTTPRL